MSPTRARVSPNSNVVMTGPMRAINPSTGLTHQCVGAMLSRHLAGAYP